MKKGSTIYINSHLRAFFNEITLKKNWDLKEYSNKCLKDYYSKHIMESARKKSNKDNIIDNFKIMIDYVFSSEQKAASFKAREYADTIKAMLQYDGEINYLKHLIS